MHMKYFLAFATERGVGWVCEKNPSEPEKFVSWVKFDGEFEFAIQKFLTPRILLFLSLCLLEGFLQSTFPPERGRFIQN